MFDSSSRPLRVHQFSSCVDGLFVREVIDYPHYYQPSDIAKLAAQELKDYLEMQNNFQHNFGLKKDQPGLIIGKMFGVLVVKDQNGQLGYLAAFSGKLANKNDIPGFVPPIYNNLDPTGFYKIGEGKLNQLTAEINLMESDEALKNLAERLDRLKQEADVEIETFKKKQKALKKERKQIRTTQKDLLNEHDYGLLLEELKKQSLYNHFKLRDLKSSWASRLDDAEKQLNQAIQPLTDLKKLRMSMSIELQEELHHCYQFLNAHGDKQDLFDLFADSYLGKPPAGAGECSAPKLFQYAYKNHLTPVAMAEFWWGVPPKSEVKRHGDFYPACRGKCEPILEHMTKGLKVAPNPLLKNPTVNKPLEVLFEDEYIVAINKPHEFLSVPGKTIKDSVLSRLKKKYPDAKGGLLLHRLDMSTSGVLLAAKYEDIYKHLQRQFIRRQIEKRYVAILEGKLESQSGSISLPLRVDLNNRPHQLVCNEHGKNAITDYQIDQYIDGKTRIYFYPKSGRTHQLRVHSAHHEGLGVPILGDDLYGHSDERLYLHAEKIAFIHPYTKEKITIEAPAPF